MVNVLAPESLGREPGEVRHSLQVAKETPMSEDTGFQFTDDAVPRAYEEVLVPRLF